MLRAASSKPTALLLHQKPPASPNGCSCDLVPFTDFVCSVKSTDRRGDRIRFTHAAADTKYGGIARALIDRANGAGEPGQRTHFHELRVDAARGRHGDGGRAAGVDNQQRTEKKQETSDSHTLLGLDEYAVWC